MCPQNVHHVRSGGGAQLVGLLLVIALAVVGLAMLTNLPQSPPSLDQPSSPPTATKPKTPAAAAQTVPSAHQSAALDPVGPYDLAKYHGAQVLALGGKGRLLATCRATPRFKPTEVDLRVWDLVTGEAVVTIAQPPDCRMLSVSPNGKLLAGLAKVADGGVLMVWSLPDGNRVLAHPVAGPRGRIAFSQDSRRLLFSNPNLTPLSIDIDTGVATELSHCPPPSVAAYSPTEEIIVLRRASINTREDPKSVDVYRLTDSSPVATFDLPANGGALAFSGDGAVLAAVHRQGMTLYDSQSWLPTADTPRVSALISQVTLSHDGQFAVVLSRVTSQPTILWRLPRGKSRPLTLGRVLDAEATPTGQFVLALEDAGVAFFDPVTHRTSDRPVNATGKLPTPNANKPAALPVIHPGPYPPTERLAVSPDGRQAVMFHGGGGRRRTAGHLRVWDLTTGRAVGPIGDRFVCSSVAFSPDGRLIAAAGGATGGAMHATFLKVWDVQTGQLRAEAQVGFAGAVGFSHDGRRAYCVRRGRDIQVIDVTTGEATHFRGSGRSPGLIGLGVTLPWLVIGNGVGVPGGEFAGSVDVYDTQSLAQVGTFNLKTAARALALSPDGKTLAIGIHSHIDLWDTGDWTLAATLPRAEAPTLQAVRDSPAKLNFSPDGRYLVDMPGTDEEATTLWDLTARTRHVIADAPCADIAFAPQGVLMVALKGRPVMLVDPTEAIAETDAADLQPTAAPGR